MRLSHIYIFILFLMVQLSNSVDYNAVWMNGTSDLYPHNVTGSVGDVNGLITVYNDRQNWFAAEYNCKAFWEDGWLEFQHEYSKRWQIVMHHLRDIGLPSNVTMWVGRFKPFPHVERWFNLKCFEGVTTDYNNSEEQCAALHFNSFLEKPELTALNCFQEYTYACFRRLGNVQVNFYPNWSIVSDLPSFVDALRLEDMSLDNCTETCLNMSCVGLSMYHDNDTCILLILELWYGRLTYEIAPSSEYVTQGVRIGLNASYVDRQAPPPNLTSYKFPDCGVSPVSVGYCEVPAMSESELQSAVEQIISNLTVDADSTSQVRRKHVSAPDERATSKTVGALGVILCIVVICLPVMADVLTLKQRWDFRHCKKIRKRKPNST